MKVSAPMDEYDIGIVGYGPVGATLANLLGAAGIAAVAFEREASIYHQPRAGHFDGETVRVFQTFGLAEQIVAGTIPHGGMTFVDPEGKLLVDWPRSAEPGPSGWIESYRFHQPALETVLREGAQRYPRVRTALRNDVFALDVDRDGVVIRSEDLATGRLMRTRCRYVIGCDGARSTVRRFMGVELDDLKFHERWLILDAILKTHVELPRGTVQYCGLKRPSTYIRMVGDRRRWELMLLPGEDPGAITRPENVWPLLARWITPETAELERSVVYTFHSVLARGWRRGRLLIAGDSAHQMPPFLGQGLCSGIRDAANLAWKLVAVIQGRADESLLDTYESERAPHVREYIDRAVETGKFVEQTKAMLERGGLTGDGPRVIKSIQPALGPGLHAPDDAWAGRQSEQPTLSDGRRLDDAAGYRFALIGDAALLDGADAETKRRWRDAEVAVFPGEGAAYLQRMGVAALMIRPDRYLLGGARNAAELVALTARLPSRAMAYS